MTSNVINISTARTKRQSTAVQGFCFDKTYLQCIHDIYDRIMNQKSISIDIDQPIDEYEAGCTEEIIESVCIEYSKSTDEIYSYLQLLDDMRIATSLPSHTG